MAAIVPDYEINASLKSGSLVTGQRRSFVAVVRMHKALSFEKYMKRITR